MWLKTLVLFFTPLLSGLLVFLLPKNKSFNYRLILVFAGSYLFSITIIHILPELFHQPVGEEYIGLCVLGGFFFQQLLEYFTSGIEHGHIHTHVHTHEIHDHQHSHHLPHVRTETQKTISALVLLTALCIHAFLEGAMLTENDAVRIYDINAILIGIALHRAPAAFALMTVLTFQLGNKNRALPYLVGFSMAAPLGLFISNYLTELQILSETGIMFLYAVVCGNFLHISTTIVYESSPEHHFNAKKLAVVIFGALVAVFVEQVI